MNPQKMDSLVKLRFRYRNHRGEEATRTVVPVNLFVGATEHHPERQLLLQAFCCDRKQERTFAVKDILSRLEVVGAEKEPGDSFAGCEWQQVGEDEWVFGKPVRGMVRRVLGEFYFDEGRLENKDNEGGWVWMAYRYHVNGIDVVKRGTAATYQGAARCIEEALGIGESKEEKSCTP